MQIHESAENYLETILMIQKEKGYVRSIDVAHHLNFSKPSVSRAMTLLKTNGYIIMDPDGHLHLTETGQEIAERIYERHCILSQWLTELGVDPQLAAEDACRIEHDISEVTFEKIKEHIRDCHHCHLEKAE
ncbi:MAG: metal-dependent transcriptional regulator [Clostridiales bacterium]|nr:metal-dependent transcriptional regulator [Clostridiales bacterium]